MAGYPKPKFALGISGLYFIIALGAWLLPLVAKPGESLAGVFLVLFAQPWASLWIWVSDKLEFDSFALSMAFMLAGIIINTLLLYRIFSYRARR